MPPRRPPPPPWTLAPAAAAAAFKTDPVAGLTPVDAAARLARDGPNELEREPATPMWRLVLAQFDDMLVKAREEREGEGGAARGPLRARRSRPSATAARGAARSPGSEGPLARPGARRGRQANGAAPRRARGGRRRRLAVPQPEPLHFYAPQVLLAAAAVSFGLALADGGGEEGARAFVEPAVIVAILVLNAVVGVWQESNAEAALAALKDMQPDVATVVRGGVRARVPARELVVGDVIRLTAGDRVPADARLLALETATLRVEQASLTGESVAAAKEVEAVDDPGAAILDKTNTIFAATAVVSGAATAMITATGMGTEMGAIQAQIAAAEEEEGDTPLKKKLDAFGEGLAACIAVVCVLVWLINWRHFVGWEALKVSARPAALRFLPIPDLSTLSFNLAACVYYFKIAVALAVAAIPEGLPAVITTCLALGTRKMAKRNAIVRRLPSVETLGCTSVICSDKTGTLTTNQMAALEVVTFGGGAGEVVVAAVGGSSFDPADGAAPRRGPLPPSLDAAAAICALCNDARLERAPGGGPVKAAGAPTEAALLTLAEKLAASPTPGGPLAAAAAAYGAAMPRVATLEFDRERKSMGVLVSRAGGGGARGRRGAKAAASIPAALAGAGNALLVKGAAECVLARCTHAALADGRTIVLPAPARAALAARVDAMAGRALRVLALAVRVAPLPPALATFAGDAAADPAARALLSDAAAYPALESGLALVALVGLQDPPRAEVPAAMVACGEAGIRVIVITGDNRATADAICCQVGVFPPSGPPPGASVTGREFAALPAAGKAALLARPGGLCVSRAEPAHKQAVVRALRAAGHVVAMTGDGVNDAPALKLADIGIAMGIAGTEVAKEAADMVLADDNFSSIVAAVEEGRAIYSNMQAFIRWGQWGGGGGRAPRVGGGAACRPPPAPPAPRAPGT